MPNVVANITIQCADETEKKAVETFLKRYQFMGSGFVWMDNTMKGIGNPLTKPFLAKMLKPKGL
jgi:hypothetical protein